MSINLVITTAQGYRKQRFLLNHSPKQLIIANQSLLGIEQIASEEFFSGKFLNFSSDKYMII